MFHSKGWHLLFFFIAFGAQSSGTMGDLWRPCCSSPLAPSFSEIVTQTQTALHAINQACRSCRAKVTKEKADGLLQQSPVGLATAKRNDAYRYCSDDEIYEDRLRTFTDDAQQICSPSLWAVGRLIHVQFMRPRRLYVRTSVDFFFWI